MRTIPKKGGVAAKVRNAAARQAVAVRVVVDSPGTMAATVRKSIDLRPRKPLSEWLLEVLDPMPSVMSQCGLPS